MRFITAILGACALSLILTANAFCESIEYKAGAAAGYLSFCGSPGSKYKKMIVELHKNFGSSSDYSLGYSAAESRRDKQIYGAGKVRIDCIQWYSRARQISILPTVEEEYSRAIALLNAKHYAKAMTAFTELLKKYPGTMAGKVEYELGLMFDKGLGVKENVSTAMRWFRMSAEQGNPDGQWSLGKGFEYGDGVTKDYAEAFKWYHKAAEQGHPFAQNQIGYMYDAGTGVSQNYEKAVEWYRKAAVQGDEMALYNMGSMRLNGLGVEQDYTEALRWFYLSAEKGYVDAQYELALMYEGGLGVKQDNDKAAKWYRLAAGQQHPAAVKKLAELKKMHDQAERAFSSENYSEAEKWHRKAAVQGHYDSMFSLAFLYLRGPEEVNNEREALKLLKKIVELDVEETEATKTIKNLSATALGLMYSRGVGVQENDKKAISWLSQAAKLEEYVEDSYLNYERILGITLPTNFTKARIALTGTSGDRKSFPLGLIYEHGLGVPIDLKKAEENYNFALENNFSEAAIHLAALYSQPKVQVQKQGKINKLLNTPNLGTRGFMKKLIFYSGLPLNLELERAFALGGYHDFIPLTSKEIEHAKTFKHPAALFYIGKILETKNKNQCQSKVITKYFMERSAKANFVLATWWMAESLANDYFSDACPSLLADLDLAIAYGTSTEKILSELKQKGYLYNEHEWSSSFKSMPYPKLSNLEEWRSKYRIALKQKKIFDDKNLARENKLNNPDAIAVIIGNRDYKGSTPDVDFAGNDADAMKKYVLDKLGYRPGNVIDLRDASKAEIEATFGTKEMHKGKLFDYVRADESDVIVFYSGHGVPGMSDKRGYLLAVDADPNRAELTGYPVDVLLKNLAKVPAKSMMVFIDACFSGQSPKGMIVNSMSGLTVKITTPKKSTDKMIVVTASRGDEAASWDNDAKHGLFTKHLLEALNGAADKHAKTGNKDGKVTLGEVKAYLDREMTYQARRRFSRDQHATVSGDLKTVLSAY